MNRLGGGGLGVRRMRCWRRRSLDGGKLYGDQKSDSVVWLTSEGFKVVERLGTKRWETAMDDDGTGTLFHGTVWELCV